MEQITVEMTLKTKENTIITKSKGYLTKEEIKWFSEEEKASYFLNFNNKTLIKIDCDKELNLSFGSQDSYLLIREGKLPINVEVIKYIKETNKIDTTYKIDNQTYGFILKWKE